MDETVGADGAVGHQRYQLRVFDEQVDRLADIQIQDGHDGGISRSVDVVDDAADAARGEGPRDECGARARFIRFFIAEGGRWSGQRHSQERDADCERHPERLRGEARRTLVLARTARPRHHRGRAVGEEVEDRERAREHRACKAESGDLRAAEMADDGCIGEHV